ncbi:hypothetical protein Psta_4540 [Pirellula staleyi DSM 6068]|uniref:ABC-2 family transporter protein n=1 Tax=Pirellula staleyi (strain ATCC 27377 / DSM 6068 / ICPB 4128) TaxID=530564 RepID=D2R6X9_PIRSD|nr:ABC transporter permease subunit [Pirellula staleyi]ADB19182.1 hypothetical protein Psta_4540 [Pirellula staleyi DSM 6068]
MNRAVLKKCIIEVRLLLAACALALFAFCWVRVWIVSTIESSVFSSILDKLWDKFESFAPVPLSQLVTYTGRIAMTYDEPIVVMCMSLFAIARGSDAVSGELNRGTMEMLLAQPVSRLQVLTTQAIVTITGVILLAVASYAGVATGVQLTSVQEEPPARVLEIPGFSFNIPLEFKPREKVTIPMRERVKTEHLIPGAVNLLCLGVCLAGLATLVSSWERYRWRTIGIIVTFWVLSTVAKVLGTAVDGWEVLRYVSIFTAYEPQKFISIAMNAPDFNWALSYASAKGPIELGPLGCNLILLFIGAVGYIFSAIIFIKRDLPAPL